MPEEPLFYFAYGSNMNLEQMAHRCPGANRVGRAVLEDYRFLVNETGYATLAPSKGDRVEGVLWLLLPEHGAILDEYEDHHEGFYDRCYREAIDVNGERRMALVYIDHRNTRVSVPNSGYLEKVIEGAMQNGLSETYIASLRSFGGAP